MTRFLARLPSRFTLSNRKQILLFLVPYLGGSFVLIILPALATIAIAFADYDAVRPPIWAGLANFKQLLESPLIRTTASATTLVRLVPGGRLSSHRHPGSSLCPHLALDTQSRIWPPEPCAEQPGAANSTLAGRGRYGPSGNHHHVCLSNWGGVYSLADRFADHIPSALYDAAAVDGANAWQRFSKITLPLVAPWLLLLTFRDMLVSLQNTFTPSFMMTYGGPYYATTFVPLLVYEISFDFTDLGLASALLVVTYVVIAALALGIFNIVRGASQTT